MESSLGNETIAEKMIQVGARFKTEEGSDFRIMAIAENWCMCRNKGCAPFTIHKSDLVKKLMEMLDKSRCTLTPKAE